MSNASTIATAYNMIGVPQGQQGLAFDSVLDLSGTRARHANTSNAGVVRAPRVYGATNVRAQSHPFAAVRGRQASRGPEQLEAGALGQPFRNRRYALVAKFRLGRPAQAVGDAR